MAMSAVERALDALIGHFQQPIHTAVDADSELQVSSPVLRLHLDGLRQRDDPVATTAVEWIAVYPRLRTALFGTNQKLSSSSRILLSVYEQMLDGLLLADDDASSRLCLSDDASKAVEHTLTAMAEDLTLATASRAYQDDASRLARVLVATWWRLLTRIVEQCSVKVPLQCLVAALAFVNDPSLDIHVIVGNLSQHFVYPCEGLKAIQVSVDVSSWHVDTSVWLDDGTKHAAKLFCQTVADNDSSLSSILLEQWDPLEVTRAVRAHFFGRNTMRHQPQPEQLTRLFLGRTVPYERQSEMEDKPHQRVPSLVYVVQQWAAMLDQVTLSMLDELVPIIYELLSSPFDAINAQGAIVLYQLWQISEPSLWSNYVDNLLQLLNKIVQTCRHGPTVAAVGLAQRCLLHLRPIARRRATQQWLWILDKNRHVYTADPLLVGSLTVLVALLSDHVCHANADGLELGRLGLMALLPLLRNEDGLQHDQEVQRAAMVALVNLLLAAHPVMHRHGGKIVAELLACVRHNVNDEALVQLGLHAMAVALVVCGRTGAAVLEHLQVDGNYDGRSLELVRQAHSRANKLLSWTNPQLPATSDKPDSQSSKD